MMEVFAKTSEGFQLLIIFAKSPVISGSQGRNYNSASTLTKTKSKVWRKAYHICVKHMQLPLLIHDFFYLLLQNKLKSSQKDKVRSFINITNTGEKTAIHCLSCHDWRLEVATDNYFQNPEKYYKEVKTTVDKKKLTNLYEKYKDKGMCIYYCVCVKRVTLCNCLCSSCYCFSASFIGNIGEFGAKNYFTDHRTANTIHGFRDSFLVLKILGCYQVMQKFEQVSIPIQAMQYNYNVLM